MSRINDLESAIRESYGLIREYQDIIRLSDDPREKKRAERAVAGQWDLVRGYLAEYEPLCTRMGYQVPDDVAEIAVVVPGEGALARAEAPRQQTKYEIHIARADHVAIGDGAQSVHRETQASDENR